MTDQMTIPAQVNTAYQDAVDNIMFLRNQQWSTTNYVLLAQAAIFLIARYPGLSNDGADRFFLKLLAWIAAGGGIFALWQLQFSIRNYRDRLTYIYSHYFKSDEAVGLRLDRTIISSPRDYTIVALLTFICLAAMVVVLRYM